MTDIIAGCLVWIGMSLLLAWCLSHLPWHKE
jgi:hypothetical protein